MRVVVGKIEGVQSVNVSLKDGVATIRFAPSNRVPVSRIRDAIRSNGFTAREAIVTVAGSLTRRGDTLALVVPGSGDVFVMRDAPGAAGTTAELRRRGINSRVEVAGQVSRPANRRGPSPEVILVRSFATPGD